MKLITENFINNLSSNQKTGIGALAGAGLTTAALGYMGNDIETTTDEFNNKFGSIMEKPTFEIQAGGMTGVKDGSLSIRDLLIDKTNISNGEQSISLKDAQDHYVNTKKLETLKDIAPGVIGGSATIGAIGAKIGSYKPQQVR